MGFLARRLIKQDLQNVQVLVNDTANEYFNVVEVPTTFTQGRSAFKIFGSRLLKPGVPLKMEMLDNAGNTVFISPVDLVGEEQAPFLPYRFVTVEVYRPPINKEGLGTLTILGEINPNAVNFNIPSQFQNTYNVKYEQKINLDLSTSVNSEPIRFFKSPFIQASEIVKPRIVLTPVTQSTQLFTSGSATTSPDLKGKSIAVTTGSQEREDDVTPYRPTLDIEKFTEKFKFKTGLYGGAPPIIKRRGAQRFFASKEEPPQTITIPKGNLSSKMAGGTLTIPSHTTTIKKTDGEGRTFNEEVSVPEFQAKVKEVINDSQLVLDTLPTFDDPDKTDHKIVDDFTDVPLTMSFDDVDRTIISSSVHQDSFLDLTIKNLRTFSGDVYRIKVHGKMQSQNSGFAVLADTVIESPELLRDDTSISGFLRTGYFIDQNHINSYWTASSFDGNVKSSNVAMTHTGSQYIDSLHLSGSTAGVNQSIVAETHPDYPFILEKDIIYTLSAKIKGQNTSKFNDSDETRNTGKLYFHLSGSNLNGSKKLNTNTYLGAELTDNESGNVVSLELDDTIKGIQDFNRVEHSFQPLFNLDVLRNIDTQLQIRATSGEWHISDLSLRPAQDTGFSPDEYKIIVPLPRTQRPDKLDLFIEYFDINSNTVETITTAENVDISGSAFVIDGLDNLLTGSMFMGNVEGSGIEMAGVNSAFVRSVGYQGFQSASAAVGGGFLLFSGSVLPDAPDDYKGAGLEIHDGNTGADESYLRFRTEPSILDIKTKTFFLGSETAGNFISGSNGLIEITSSNFHLQPDGDVVLQGTITAEAGGTIGGWDITSNAISDLNASGKGIEIKSDPSSPTITIKEDDNNKIELFHTTNDDYGIIGKVSGNNVFLLGDPGGQGNKIAGWSFNNEELTGGEMIIRQDGTIKNRTFQPNEAGSGFQLTADQGGFLEVENARIRGTLKTAVFEKETVNAVGGQLYVANSTVLTGSVVAPGGIHTATQTTMSVENVSGFVADEILSIKKVSSTGFGTEYVKVVSASRNDSSSETDLSGLLFVERGFGNGVSGDSGSLGDIAGAAQSYSGSQVVVSTGKPPNTGYIRLNANPNDFTTPYMDVVERTGSGIYDVDLKVRLGDLSGLSTARLQEVSAPGDPGFGLYTDNVFLKGSITATTGSIGGINMQSSQIFTGTGTHGNSNTGFFANSSGDFSLGSKFKFTNSSGELLVSGSNVKVETPTFFLGAQGNTFISGSNDLLEVSSSRFHLQPGGDTIMQGKITATSGKIGQFSIDSNDISGEGLKFLGTEGSQSIQIIDKDGSSTPAPGTIAMEILYTDTRGQRGNDVAAGPTILSDVDDIMLVTGDTGSFYVNPGMLRAWRQSGATAPSTYPLMGSGVVGITSELGDRNYQAPIFGVNSSTSTAGRQDWNAAGLFYQSFVTDIAGSGNFDRGAGIIAVGNGGDTNVSVLAHQLKTDQDGFSGVFHSGKFMVGDPFTRSDTNTLSSTNSDYTFIAYPADITGGTDNDFKGRVGINRKYPLQALHVEGNIIGHQISGSSVNVTGSITAGSNIVTSGILSTATGTEDAPAIQIGSANDGFYHLASGDSGINVLVNNVQEFLFADGGGFHADADITAFSTTVDSDIRLKENIQPLQDNLNKVLELKPSSFRWKIQDKKQDIGLIAQDVEKVIPELVKEKSSIGKTKDFLKEDTHKTIDYSKLTTILIGAIQEQQKQIDDLKKKLEDS